MKNIILHMMMSLILLTVVVMGIITLYYILIKNLDKNFLEQSLHLQQIN